MPTVQSPNFSCSHTSSQSPAVRRSGELIGDVSANTGIDPARVRLGSEAANHLLDGLTGQFEPFSRANPITTGLSECLFEHGSAHSREDLEVGHASDLHGDLRFNARRLGENRLDRGNERSEVERLRKVRRRSCLCELERFDWGRLIADRNHDWAGA